MIIDQLTAYTVKGQNFRLTLTEINLITGDNRVGKTAIPDAIAIGLYGHVPRLGETHAATFKLSSDQKNLFVELGFDDGSKNFVTFTKDEDGGISRNLAQAVKPPIVMLDVRDFFKKTEQERMKEVASKAKGVPIPFDESQFLKLIGNVEALPSEVAKHPRKRWVEDITVAIKNRGNIALTDILDRVMTRLKVKKRELDGTIKQMQAVMKGATKRDGPAPKDVKDQLDAAREAEQDASNRLAVADNQANDQREASAELKRLKGLLAEVPTLSELSAEQTKLENRRLSLAAETKAKPESAEPLARKIVAANEAVAKAVAKTAVIKEEQDRLEKQRTEISKAHKCPVCKTSGANWQNAFKEWYKASLVGIKSRLNNAKDDEKKAVAERDQIEKLYDERHSRYVRYEIYLSQLKDTEDALEELRQKFTRRGELETAITKIKDQAIDQKEIDKLNAEFSKATAKVAELEKAHEDYLLYKSQKEAFELHEKAYVQAQCEQTLIKEYVKIIAAEYESIVASTFDTLLKTARKFTDGFLRGKLEYRHGELGYMRDAGKAGTWVSWDAFSGIEELASFAGLSISLAQQSPIKLVIMDELGRLTSDNKRAILLRMSELIHAHVLDQFIGLDVSIRDYGDAKRMINEIKVEEP